MKKINTTICKICDKLLTSDDLFLNKYKICKACQNMLIYKDMLRAYKKDNGGNKK